MRVALKEETLAEHKLQNGYASGPSSLRTMPDCKLEPAGALICCVMEFERSMQ